MPQQLIDEVRICLESGLLSPFFYHFLLFLSIKLYKTVNHMNWPFSVLPSLARCYILKKLKRNDWVEFTDIKRVKSFNM